MVWALISMLTALWLIGLAFDIGGALANILLVIASILLALELAKRIRAPA